jgi:hypothetical protein
MDDINNFSIGRLNRIIERLDQIILHQKLNKVIDLQLVILDNTDFINLFKISHKTAQLWRDERTISFSQIGNKIYYRMSDIQKFLDKYYKQATELKDKDQSPA